jgi:twitching motility protein PilT
MKGRAGMTEADLDTGLRSLLETARAHAASDLHMTTGHPPILRIAGNLRTLDTAPMSRDQVIAARDRLLALDPEGAEAPPAHDMDFARTLASGERLRINVFETLQGPAMAIRRIVATPPSLENLPAPASVAELAGRRSGLILVTGATGSGKSTTLAALIDRINATRAAHILTIEDPVEYVHPNKKCLINQREVGQHTESFNTGLRAALREDPDIILVGEMRDLETISLALTAAETGQLVLATLHAPTAAQAVDRVVDVFPGNEKEMVRTMLSTSLVGVVSQILLPGTAGGRVAAMEVMTGTSAVRNQIREGKVAQLSQTIELGRRVGMQTMLQSIQDLESEGYITAETRTAWAEALGEGGADEAEKGAQRRDAAGRGRGSSRGL